MILLDRLTSLYPEIINLGFSDHLPIIISESPETLRHDRVIGILFVFFLQFVSRISQLENIACNPRLHGNVST